MPKVCIGLNVLGFSFSEQLPALTCFPLKVMGVLDKSEQSSRSEQLDPSKPLIDGTHMVSPWIDHFESNVRYCLCILQMICDWKSDVCWEFGYKRVCSLGKFKMRFFKNCIIHNSCWQQIVLHSWIPYYCYIKISKNNFLIKKLD